jgi:acyl carrier protein
MTPAAGPMTPDEIRAAVLRAVASVAPEADLATLAGNADVREQLDLDSVDFLNVLVAIHDAVGVDIPEVDYPKLSTLDACVAYLAARVRAS